MGKTVLKRKNWEIFLVFIAVQFLVLPTIIIVSFLFGPGPESVTVQLIEFFVTGLVYFSYPVMVGLKLNQLVSGQEKFKVTSTQFIMTCIIIMTTGYILGLTLNIGRPWYYLIPMTVLPCFLIILSWPARPLKSIELRRNAGIWEYVPEAFQFIVWPLGVWWIQPRLNGLDEEKVRIEE
jgi:hypothetical protein